MITRQHFRTAGVVSCHYCPLPPTIYDILSLIPRVTLCINYNESHPSIYPLNERSHAPGEQRHVMHVKDTITVSTEMTSSLVELSHDLRDTYIHP